jgi:hypothetical protein
MKEITRKSEGKMRKIILKWILEKQGWRLWIGFIWLRTGTDDGLINTEFHKRWGTS